MKFNHRRLLPFSGVAKSWLGALALSGCFLGSVQAANPEIAVAAEKICSRLAASSICAEDAPVQATWSLSLTLEEQSPAGFALHGQNGSTTYLINESDLLARINLHPTTVPELAVPELAVPELAVPELSNSPADSSLQLGSKVSQIPVGQSLPLPQQSAFSAF